MADADSEGAVTDFQAACMREYGKVLEGAKRHFCPEWDELPIDETCPEFEACLCFAKEAEAR